MSAYSKIYIEIIIIGAIQLKKLMQEQWIDQGFFQDPEQIQEHDHSFSHSFAEGRLQQQYKDFTRPSVDLQYYKSANEDLYLMGIDITYGNRPTNSKDSQGVTIQKPVIKIYAIDKNGNSFLVHVKQFVPYFYVPFPKGLVNTAGNLAQFRQAMNKLFKEREESKKTKQYLAKNPVPEEAIIDLQPVHRINIYGYIPKQSQNDTLYLKIHTVTPNVVAPLRYFFQRQERINGINLPTKTFESNIPYALRFMVDKKLTGMGWMRIPAHQYTVREHLKDSSCQVEIQCCESAIMEVKSQNQWAAIAPLRVMSFDIECAAQHGFPSAERDPIIQIACVCKVLPASENTSPDEYRFVIVLDGCSPISGVEIKQADDQRQLLRYFQQFMLTYDPDFIIGYNIINFDLPYILERAEKLKMKGYGHFGRNTGVISRIKKGTLQSKIMGNRQTKDINIEGRIQLDLLTHMIREHKLSSYSLNNVSYHFLRDQKEDVHHSQIFKLFKQSRETRKRLAIYCVKDSELPLKLLEKLCCLFNYSEMARVTGVPLNFLLNRGQQIKVVSQLLRKAKDKNFILPTKRVNKGSDEKGFEGAYVLDPIVGFYQQPIATLDFASLYPSIMMAHNLCYTTLVEANQLQDLNLEPEDVTRTPQGFYFVTNIDKRQGLLPEILQELIAARKKAKKELAAAKDQLLRNVLEGRQLALKISANSVYGFTGATVGQLPCLQISASVTAFGRKMIEQTKNSVEKLYPGSKVIYGDTDSVMVKFKLSQDQEGQYQNQDKKMRRARQIAEAMKLGKSAADQISKEFKAPIKLQFQKVYCPYLLMAKKRYVGVYYSKSNEYYDKIDKKGFESVRRDNCYLIREILQNILDLLLCQDNPDEIPDYVKKVISELVQNKIDISKLVITKAISKKSQEDEDPASKKTGKNTYKVKQAHVELAAKMQKRDGNTTFNIGDRISYVMIEGAKGSKNYQNAEDPIRVLEQDIPINYDYYIQKQIRPPLERLLYETGIIPNIDVLFTGDHTKNRYIPKINKNNMLGRFVTVQSTCTNCPARSDKGLCDRCRGKYLQIAIAKQIEIEQMKAQYQDLWGECQKCQGSVTMDVLCSNADCPIYYKRIKVKNDLGKKAKQMARIDELKDSDLITNASF